jgi:hypothetical protein
VRTGLLRVSVDLPLVGGMSEHDATINLSEERGGWLWECSCGGEAQRSRYYREDALGDFREHVFRAELPHAEVSAGTTPLPPEPLAVDEQPGDPPHPAPLDTLALAIERSRQTILEVIASSPDVTSVNSVSLRLTTIESIFEWYVETLRTAAEEKRLALGGSPRPQG